MIEMLWHAMDRAPDQTQTLNQTVNHVRDRMPSVGRASRPHGIKPHNKPLLGLGTVFGAVIVALALGTPFAASAADNEIRIGNTIPYTGPAASYGIIGKTIAAYFNSINDQGGINGRKINFISYDDAYNPQKTVEQTRKLVEDDKVLLLFAGLGL